MKRWRGIIAIEGRLTEDGRYIERDALTWETPLPLCRPNAREDESWSTPIIGSVESIERIDKGEFVLVAATGTLHSDPPERLDLAVTVLAGEHDYVEPEVDSIFPFAVRLTAGRIANLYVGGQRVWDECVLEVIGDEDSSTEVRGQDGQPEQV